MPYGNAVFVSDNICAIYRYSSLNSIYRYRLLLFDVYILRMKSACPIECQRQYSIKITTFQLPHQSDTNSICSISINWCTHTESESSKSITLLVFYDSCGIRKLLAFYYSLSDMCGCTLYTAIVQKHLQLLKVQIRSGSDSVITLLFACESIWS